MKYLNMILIFFVLLTSCNKEAPGVDLIITAVHIIDIQSGRVTKHQDVYIKDGLISDITESKKKKFRTARYIDGSDKYLIPSLWDMHVHIQDSTYLRQFLKHGILGVRDMGGCTNLPTDGCESLCIEHLASWKKRIQEGTMDGPQLYLAGTLLSGTGWPSSHAVSNEQEVAKAFEDNLANEVDFIKVYEKIPWASYVEIARLSKKNNLHFVGHVSEPYLLSDILDLGQKSIEHIREPILYSFTKDSVELEQFMVADQYTDEDRTFVQPWIDDAENVLEAFKRNKAWFVPTMAVQYARQRYRDSTWINHPNRKYMPASVNQGLKKHMKRMESNEDKQGDLLWWMALNKLVKRFNDEGIALLAGSDSACEGGLPGYSLHEELQLMVGAGLSPLEALQTATKNPSRYFNLESSGEVKKNYLANLVMLDKNPLDDIKNTLSINTVIKNGIVYPVKNNSFSY